MRHNTLLINIFFCSMAGSLKVVKTIRGSGIAEMFNVIKRTIYTNANKIRSYLPYQGKAESDLCTPE